MTITPSQPAIRATGLRKSFGDQLVLDGIDLEVAEGTVFALLGPNGAGKITTVHILSTLIRADGGEVRVGGHDVAREVARGLVVYLHRPGGQSQFSTPMRSTTPRSEPLRVLQAFIDANPAGDLSVPALARRAGMSDRHFSRVFTEQTGLPPGRYVERSRADTARRLLEETGHPLDRVARESGLGAAETLYRVFRRHWRVAPGDYRRRFRSQRT